MAAGLGKIISKRQPDGDIQGEQAQEHDFGVTFEEFQSTFYDEFLDMLTDSDNLVKINAFYSVSTLIG